MKDNIQDSKQITIYTFRRQQIETGDVREFLTSFDPFRLPRNRLQDLCGSLVLKFEDIQSGDVPLQPQLATAANGYGGYIGGHHGHWLRCVEINVGHSANRWRTQHAAGSNGNGENCLAVECFHDFFNFRSDSKRVAHHGEETR